MLTLLVQRWLTIQSETMMEFNDALKAFVSLDLMYLNEEFLKDSI